MYTYVWMCMRMYHANVYIHMHWCVYVCVSVKHTCRHRYFGIYSPNPCIIFGAKGGLIHTLLLNYARRQRQGAGKAYNYVGGQIP